MSVCVNDIEQADNVRIIHFLEKRDFAYSSARYSFIFSFQANFFQSNYAPVFRREIPSFIYNTIGPYILKYIIRENDCANDRTDKMS